MRTRRTPLLAATGVALAGLALTACGSGSGTKDEGAAPVSSSKAASSSVSSAQPASDSGTARSTGATGTANGSGSASGKGSGSGSGSKPASGTSGSAKATGSAADPGPTNILCNGSNTTVTAQPMSRPLNHMLITVKNTGRKTCMLPYHPVLRFDEMQWVPQADEATHPQAVTTLRPGESGYAGVLLSAADGSGSGGMTAHKLTVGFQGRTPNSDGGPAATPSLPAKGVYYDSTLKVTYWQQSIDDVLSW
ncbi:hypothetical protein GCM10010503_64360 [Streptomyces lucensis JCM 4490]|uniref:DUF4232 domain-containing protein n=1 Tax=Streptomyces lucensis JCM 4490 TaxID=1306176 RepID=A0A918MVV5_9ACTN|nr:DUF4232 domain-containing protein [Streptomyces lucensis]GGW77691.1 hypothetical protein GCM10010503_64360 [Streptomyces lucensis JCM 4490]